MPISDRDYTKFPDEERRPSYGDAPPRSARAENPAFYREAALSLKVALIIVLSVVLGLTVWLWGDQIVSSL